MKRLKQFLKWMYGYKSIYLISIIIIIILQYFRTYGPLFVTHLIDYTLGTEASPLPKFVIDFFNGTTVKEEVLYLAIIYVVFTLCRVILMITRRIINAYFTEGIAYDMRNKLYSKLQNLSFNYHSHAETGDLIQRCTTDVETFRAFVGEQLIEIFRLVFLVGMTIYQMQKLNVEMTIYSVIVTPVIFFAAFIYFQKVKKVFVKVEEAEATMTTTLQESVTGIRVVKAFAKEQYEIDKFEEHSKEYMKEDYKLLKYMAVFWGSTDFINFVQYAVTITVGAYFAVRGDITVGEYTAFLMYIGMIVWPLRQLGRIIGDFGKTTVSLDRLDEIMLKESEHKDDSNNEPPIEGHVEFRNVSFQFEDDHKPLLKDISFTVNKGESIAIVGKTGSGKSTLINLMIRLLDNDSGSILFDGVDIKDINKKHLRTNVGIIMQEPFLYSRTVYDNISIMNKTAEKDSVFQAASIASLHQDIEGFESGYETMVGERGVKLSGGQKQRVSIARVFLKNPPVLILDEATSSLDNVTEKMIQKALDELSEGRTTLVIAHRLSTISNSDEIFVLTDKGITERGTHKELIKSGGYYEKLYNASLEI